MDRLAPARRTAEQCAPTPPHNIACNTATVQFYTAGPSDPLTPAERAAAYRARRKAAEKPVVVRYRRPADRRSRPQRWQAAVEMLAGLLDGYQDWRDNLPAGLAETALADRLDEVLTLRDLVEQLQAAELPKGFGRD
jgi:hypothetical protein